MKQNTTQIRISDILFAIMKKWLLILICTAVGLVVGVILSGVNYLKGEISKQYVIKESIAVTSQNESGLFTSASKDPDSNDIYLAQEMTDSVIYVLKSDRTLNEAVDKLDLIGVNVNDIYNNLQITQYNETQIVEISLYWRNAKEGVEILEAINAVAPDILQDTLKIGNVSVVNVPTSKYLIGGNLSITTWIYMAVFGFIVGAGIAVLGLLLKPTLINTRDVERMLQMEILGEIPEDKTYFKKQKSLLVESEDDWEIMDSYNSLAHIVRHRLNNSDHKIIYVTATLSGEGKTTVTANLAAQLSRMDKKVLLIDFDTRNPKLGGLFVDKVDYEHSLNALYRGDATKEEAITYLSGNLDMLPMVLERKSIPLDDEIFNLIRDLSQDYDYVLMDTSPIGLVSDVMGLNRLADVAVFVTRFDYADMSRIRESLEKMDKSGVRVLGCVVNAVKKTGIKSKQYYGYGAKYTSSLEEDKKVKKLEDQIVEEIDELEEQNKLNDIASDIPEESGE